MLEIFLVWRLAVRIGNQAAQKGFKKFGYQLMLVVLWICGELLSGVLGYVILGEANSFWITYILALLGAAFGAGIAFLIMRLLPKQSLSDNLIDAEKEQERLSAFQKLSQSGCLPVLVILLAISCLFVGLGGAVVAGMRSIVRQINVSDPIVATKISNNGQISRPVTEIAPNTETIYLSFHLEMPEGASDIPLTFNWLVNGQLMYSGSPGFNGKAGQKRRAHADGS